MRLSQVWPWASIQLWLQRHARWIDEARARRIAARERKAQRRRMLRAIRAFTDGDDRR